MQANLTRFLLEVGPWMPVLLVVLLVLLGSFVSKRTVRRLQTSGHLSPLMARRLQRTRRWFVVLVALLTLLHFTGNHENAWTFISAVLATIAVGFVAAWSLLSNATGALLIIIFRPFHHGDSVQLVEPTNGTTLGGVVIDMNLMFTTLSEPGKEDDPSSHLHVPNNLFFQKVVRTRRESRLSQTAPFFGSQMDEDASAAFGPVNLGDGSESPSRPPSTP